MSLRLVFHVYDLTKEVLDDIARLKKVYNNKHKFRINESGQLTITIFIDDKDAGKTFESWDTIKDLLEYNGWKFFRNNKFHLSFHFDFNSIKNNRELLVYIDTTRYDLFIKEPNKINIYIDAI